MIYRLKNLLRGIEGIEEEEYNTRKEFHFNNVHFRAFPAANIDAMRSQPIMRAILIDEGAFFPQKDQSLIRAAAEHYFGATKLKIVWISPAGDPPAGAFYDIGREADVTNGGIYRKYIVDYKKALIPHPQSGTTLLIPAEIEQLKNSPTFARNFLHVWGAATGNIFTLSDLNACTQSHNYTPRDGFSALNVDPAYGSSNFAIVGMVKVQNMIYVTESQQFSRPEPVSMWNLIKLKSANYDIVTYDGHWAGDIRALEELGVKVRKMNYSDKLLKMTQRAAEKVKKHQVIIPPSNIELLEQLRAIVYNEKGVPDKKRVPPFDLGDAFLQGIHELTDENVVAVYVDPD